LNAPAEPDAKGNRHDCGDRLFIGSVAKCFAVLELLNEADRPLSLAEIARRSNFGKSAAQRATHTLRVLGYLRQHPDTRAYALSSKMLEFTHTVLAQDRVRSLALPLLEALNRICGETVNLSRLEGSEVVIIARFPSLHAVSVDLHIGSRLPAFCTAPGRAILSMMPEKEARLVIEHSKRKALTEFTETDPVRLWTIVKDARKRGYAMNNQESHLGDVSIAAALVDQAGRAVGAINIAAPSPRLSIAQLQHKFRAELLRTARDISRQLGVL
jgi:IclR family pca regulon transcriptional regulator